jgi:acetyl esterase/lipase
MGKDMSTMRASLTRRGLVAAGSAAVVMPGFASAAPGAEGGGLAFVDPELRPAAARLLQDARGRPPMTLAGLPAARAHAAVHPPLAAPAWRREVIPGPADAPALTVYVVNAEPGGRRPAILHTHGGGYILGSARSDLPMLQRTAAALDCVIVTVEYRLAPETTYAGSMEDTYAGLKWLHAHAEELGADPARIALMGESAGGGHAALLALTARDRGEVPVIFQALVYPMLDDRTATLRTPSLPIGLLVWTPEQNRLGWRAFLGHSPGEAGVPARAVPARYANLAGLPPAWIGVGGIDLFVNEDLAYADRLIDAHVPTEVMVLPGAFHGFDGIAAETAVARRFTAAKLDALRRAFAGAG